MIKAILRGFQKDAVDFIDYANGKMILGDDMGIGKTVETLAWCEKWALKALIICPSSLKYNWEGEISKHTDNKCVIIKGKELKIGSDIKYVIISYGMLSRFIKIEKRMVFGKMRDIYSTNETFKREISNRGFNTLLVDEAHYIKNWKAKRTKSVLAIKKDMNNYIFMSGTSIRNRPIELWTQISAIADKDFNNFKRFAFRYCKPTKRGNGFDYKGADNIGELHERIKWYYLRRRKEDVLDELPDKTRQIIYNDMDTQDMSNEYMPLVEEIRNLEDYRHQLTALTKLKHKLAELITIITVEFVRNIIENTDRNILFFSAYLSPLNTIYSAFPEKTIIYTGELSAVQKDKVKKRFEVESDLRIFASTIRAGGEGLTLTKADKVIMNDVEWSPAECFQAEDRAYRMGQKFNVNVYYFGFKGTYQETLFAMIDRKAKIVDAVQDGNVSDLDSEGSVLNTIIKSIKNSRGGK